MKHDNRYNIVLVGMPGAGKSTVGVILAKHTSRNFIDTDVLIQTTKDKPLQDIIDEHGYMGFRGIEEKVLVSLELSNHVIATGGSAVYSAAAMGHLKENGVVVFLNVDFSVLERRIQDFHTRGIARRPEQTFAELFEERYVLYRKYADIIIDCGSLTQEYVSKNIAEELSRTFDE